MRCTISANKRIDTVRANQFIIILLCYFVLLRFLMVHLHAAIECMPRCVCCCEKSMTMAAEKRHDAIGTREMQCKYEHNLIEEDLNW